MHHSAKVVPVVAILIGSIFSPAFTMRLKKDRDVALNVTDDHRDSFSTILEYAKKARAHARLPIFKAACDSIAFTSEEIIQLASFGEFDVGSRRWGSGRWFDTVMLFAQGRANEGCISDTDNSCMIVEAFEERRRSQWSFHNDNIANSVLNDHMLDILTLLFITYLDVLKPAIDVAPPPMQLQTGLRTDEDMEKLLGEVRRMKPLVFYTEGFKIWLKHIRARGEQFSGAQLVTLVNALPFGYWLAQAVSVLLEHLEQYVVGVTCKEVNKIQMRMAFVSQDARYMMAGLAVLKSNIVDGQNKAAIVADTIAQGIGPDVADQMERMLRDLVVGLPPKNNPIFGVVKGNPVIFVIDESDSMDANFTLGNDTFTRRKFCHSQLEVVLEALPNGTYFNVIPYSTFAVKIFREPVLASKTNINFAMGAVSSTWSDDYAPGRDPDEWLAKLHRFSVKSSTKFKGNSRSSMRALQLAYAAADLPSQQTDELVATHEDEEDLPQIFFLTSGQPDGGVGQILNKIDEFDNGRDIPINSITFFNASADPLTKQLGKALAKKTGGFFRSIEQA